VKGKQNKDMEIEVETCYLSQVESRGKPYDLPGQVLGMLISNITERLAFQDTNLRPFVEYLQGTALWGGIDPILEWKNGVPSSQVLSELRSRRQEEKFSKWRTEY
jgi:hypothetical protein